MSGEPSEEGLHPEQPASGAEAAASRSEVREERKEFAQRGIDRVQAPLGGIGRARKRPKRQSFGACDLGGLRAGCGMCCSSL